MASRRDHIENRCANCMFYTNSEQSDTSYIRCSAIGCDMLRERHNCDWFLSKKDAPAVNDKSDRMNSIIDDVDSSSEIIRTLSNGLVCDYSSELDEEMMKIRNLLADSQTLTDYELEYEILALANILYYTGSAQEDLGIKEDMCKAIRQEVYSKARENASGKTVADKTTQAELMAQVETTTLAIYSRSYKKLKTKVDAGYEMLNSLKKVMNRRISELELSNSRYINKSEV